MMGHTPVRGHAIRHVWLCLALLVAILAGLSPANAHTDHKKKPPVAAKVVPGAPQPADEAASTVGPGAMHSQMGEMMEVMEVDRSKMDTFERLLDWLGRTHPVIVHFPIAFFPAALFTAIVGRKRSAFAKPVQFLILAGGIIAPVAALFGWFSAGLDFSTDDALLQFHRWLGTAVGVGGLALAIWAARRPEDDRGPGMILGLAIMTAAIIAQGWFGGALVHGIGHMNW